MIISTKMKNLFLSTNHEIWVFSISLNTSDKMLYTTMITPDKFELQFYSQVRTNLTYGLLSKHYSPKTLWGH